MATSKPFRNPITEAVNDPTRSPLRGDEGAQAVKGQLYTYPKIVRGHSDSPVSNQGMGLVSFALLEDPVTISSGKKVFGFVKLRGNYPDYDSCKREASKIIKEVDSNFQVRIGAVGQWLPITDDDTFVKEQIDVDTEETEDGEIPQLRTEATLRKQKEDERRIKELKERSKEVQENDVYDDHDSIEYYVMKRVADMKLFETYEETLAKLKELKEKMTMIHSEVNELTEKHPEHNEKWLDKYNEKRKELGIPGEFTPTDSYLEYCETNK